MDYSYTRETLNNGLRLMWMDLPHVHSVAIHATVQAGPAYETKDNNGVSHLLEHLHMAVTRRHSTRSDLEAAFAELPADRNAQTSADTLEFTCDGPPDVGAELATLVADILEVRDYPAEVVASEKRLIESELVTDETSIELLKRLFKKHPFALPPAGTRRTLKRISTEKLRDFDARSFSPNRIITAIVGHLLPGTLERARASLGQLARVSDHELQPPAPPQLHLPVLRRETPKHLRRHVLMGFVVAGVLTPAQRLALKMLDLALTLT